MVLVYDETTELGFLGVNSKEEMLKHLSVLWEEWKKEQAKEGAEEGW